jgi:hypothetical protein
MVRILYCRYWWYVLQAIENDTQTKNKVVCIMETCHVAQHSWHYFLQQATFYIYLQCRYSWKLQTLCWMLRILEFFNTNVTERSFVGGIIQLEFSPWIQKLCKTDNILFLIGHLEFVQVNANVWSSQISTISLYLLKIFLSFFFVSAKMFW